MGFSGVISSQPQTHLNPQLSPWAAFGRLNQRLNPHATAHRPLLGCIQLQLCGSDVTQETMRAGHPRLFIALFLFSVLLKKPTAGAIAGEN